MIRSLIFGRLMFFLSLLGVFLGFLIFGGTPIGPKLPPANAHTQEIHIPSSMPPLSDPSAVHQTPAIYPATTTTVQVTTTIMSHTTFTTTLTITGTYTAHASGN